MGFINDTPIVWAGQVVDTTWYLVSSPDHMLYILGWGGGGGSGGCSASCLSSNRCDTSGHVVWHCGEGHYSSTSSSQIRPSTGQVSVNGSF